MSAIRSICLSALLATLTACVSHTPTSATPPVSVNGVKGDPIKGKALVMSSCMTCHGVTKEVDSTKMVGPSLFGVVGRKAGTVKSLLGPSENLTKYGVTWTTETLDVFLTNPLAVLAPDTAMAGILKDPQQRIDVIAYLATLKN